MENNRTYDVSSMPGDGGSHLSGLTHSAWREKADTIKSRSLRTLDAARTVMVHRVTAVTPVAQRGVRTMRSRARSTMMKAQNHLRRNPAKWTGIAMGAGFTAGLLGRIKLHRSLHRSMPEVLVLSAEC